MVEAVRASADLRTIVSEYLPLKKSGQRYRALCPFHSEKTPSFYVDADKQLFYCFGCGAGGDVFKFLMLYEKMEFPEALRSLAGRFGITIPSAGTPENSDRERVVAANRRALGYFREQLQGSQGRKALEYLKGRGLATATIDRFRIGYAPDAWGGLKSFLGSAAESHGVLAGLLARKDGSGHTYDRFRDRVIFPIVNLADDVIGFGGRILGAGEPKYLNSPETAAFSKGENLYAVALAKEAIRKEGYAVLVEGYMDVIALHQAGITHVVATLGTGFTAGHVRLLKRYTDRVAVNFDPDAAGRAATRRSLDVLLENGFEIEVVALPAGKDPDVFVREQGADAYRARLAAAVPYLEYVTRDAATRLDVATTRGKVQALNEVLPFVARLDNPVRRAAQVEMIAGILDIEDRLVLQELKDAVRQRARRIDSPLPAGTAVSDLEARLVRALMEDGEARRTILVEIDDADLEKTRVAEVVSVVRGLTDEGEDVTYPAVLARIGDDARGIVTRIAALPHPPATLEEGRGCLKALRAARFQRQMRDIQKQLESGGEAAETDDLLRRKVALKRKIEALRQASPLS